jgi:FlaA1/EpsC-like NDP-sugar epimerase
VIGPPRRRRSRYHDSATWQEPDAIWTRFAELLARVRCDLPFVGLDIALLSASYMIALVIRFNGSVPHHNWQQFLGYLPVALLVHLGANWICGLYGRIWRHAGVEEARRVLLSGAVSLVVLLVATFALGRLMPLSVLIVGNLLGTMLLGATRFQSRLLALHRRTTYTGGLRIAVLGAGEEAAGAVREMLDDPRSGLIPVLVLDDDPHTRGRTLRGIPVVGRISDLPVLAYRYGVHQALLAVGSADPAFVQQAADAAERAGLPLKVLPPATERVGGRTVSDIRDMRIDDLLGRHQVKTDLCAVEALVRGRRLLITGAGGSIGAEIVRQVARYGPAELILLDHDETHLHDAAASANSAVTTQALVDIRDSRAVQAAFAWHQPNIVFHAAAHKHVPLLEDHPCEAALTNVIGSQNVIDAAMAVAVERLVFVSTDKAVRPASVMGASKRIGEYLVVAGAPPAAQWCAVRFGNVLGSRGSVVPTFMQQIAAGGPVTVTDARMTRYFMSVEEAVQLVLQAAALSDGGEIFMLEMGQPVRILELAQRMIRLSGLAVGNDIEVRITGVRPGEKLAEELAEIEEQATPTPHPSIVRLRPLPVDAATLRQGVAALQHLASVRDHERAAEALRELAARRPVQIDLDAGRLWVDEQAPIQLSPQGR